MCSFFLILLLLIRGIEDPSTVVMWVSLVPYIIVEDGAIDIGHTVSINPGEMAFTRIVDVRANDLMRCI